MTNGMRPVKETNMGLYVWEMPNLKWIGDDEGNFLTIPAVEGSARAIALITKEVEKYLDPVVGKPLFLAGRRQIDDDEYERQKARARAGLVPDPMDYHALQEEAKYK